MYKIETAAVSNQAIGSGQCLPVTKDCDILIEQLTTLIEQSYYIF